MDAETECHITHAKAIDGIFYDIARFLSNDMYNDDRAAAGTLALAGLESSDRLTVTKTQAQLLMYISDLLNRGDDD